MLWNIIVRVRLSCNCSEVCEHALYVCLYVLYVCLCVFVFVLMYICMHLCSFVILLKMEEQYEYSWRGLTKRLKLMSLLALIRWPL